MTTISSTVEIPNQVPRELVAGDTWAWNRHLADFPAAAWTLTYYFRGAGSLDAIATTAPDGISYTIIVGAAATAKLQAGAYRWTAKVSNGDTDEVYTVGQDDVKVLENYASAFPGDLQPNAELMLRAIEAEISARLGVSARSTIGGASSPATAPGSAHEHISIAGREITKIPIKDLYTLRSRYRNEVAMLENGGVLPDVAVVFSDRSPTLLDRTSIWEGP